MCIRSFFGSHRRNLVIGERQQSGPVLQIPGEIEGGQPGPILVKVLEWEIGQPSVFGDADPVLTSGLGPVTNFQISQLTTCRVRRERDQPVPINIVEA
jgi:hypothetical protein